MVHHLITEVIGSFLQVTCAGTEMPFERNPALEVLAINRTDISPGQLGIFSKVHVHVHVKLLIALSRLFV